MRRVFVALIPAVSVVAFTHMASAADLYQPAYKAPPPPPPPVADWSGVYVGLEGGYGWGNQRIDPAFAPFSRGGIVAAPLVAAPFTPATPTVSSVNQSGWLFGGFAGAQKQWGNWVLGIEADFDGADINGSSTSSSSQPFDGGRNILTRNVTIDSKIDELGSVRGKVGFAPWQNWLVYGTGGLAFAHVQESATWSQTEKFLDGFPNFTDNFSGGASMLGWAAGAGVDWKYQIDPGSSLVLGVEYLHYQFPTNTLTLANQFGSFDGGDIAFNTKQSVDTIKGRISYLFSIH